MEMQRSGTPNEIDSPDRHNSWSARRDDDTYVNRENVQGIQQGSVVGMAWPSSTPSTVPPRDANSAWPDRWCSTAPCWTNTWPFSISRQRLIDEAKELAKLMELLANVLVRCYILETSIRVQESHLERLKMNQGRNGLVVERLYHGQCEGAKRVAHERRQNQKLLEKKFSEAEREIEGDEERYRVILDNRDEVQKELFEYERRVANNNAESQFRARRIGHMQDEVQFYEVKNQAFKARRDRLRCELEEAVCAQDSIKVQLDVLAEEKLSKEQAHAAELAAIQESIDVCELGSFQPSKSYVEQLNHDVQRLRKEYEKKSEACREELHRRFEFEMRRYYLQGPSLLPKVPNEVQHILIQYEQEKKDVQQQIASMNGRVYAITAQIKEMEDKLLQGRRDGKLTADDQERLAVFHQMVRDRERQLKDSIGVREALRRQIASYEKLLDGKSRQDAIGCCRKRASLHDCPRPSTVDYTEVQRSSSRLSLQSVNSRDRRAEESPPVRRRVRCDSGPSHVSIAPSGV